MLGDLPVLESESLQAYRLVNSKFPPIALFDDVADGIDTFDIGILIGIGADIAFAICHHTGGSQVKLIGCRFTTNRPDQTIDIKQDAAIFQINR